MENKPLIAIMGPTGIGKTSLALDIANQLDSEIVSVDSVQVYKGLDIGSGKPPKEILYDFPHKLIDVVDPYEAYSTGNFQEDCAKELDKITYTNKTPLLVGGTMLYFKHLFFGFSDLPKSNEETRTAIEKEAKEIGLSSMHDQLQLIDPISAENIHPNDSQRIIRAIEVYRSTDITLSVWLEKNKSQIHKSLNKYKVFQFALKPSNKEEHRKKVGVRFKQMLEDGLIGEVEGILSKEKMDSSKTSMRSVGYRQVSDYLEGKLSYDEMVFRGITATRQLATRQMTWLRSWENIIWLDEHSTDNVNYILKYINNHE